MNAATITKILKAHGIPFYEKNGNIYADSMISGTALYEHTENVTGWTASKLYSWLGY